jgi:CTP synthase (UTP-ammonia lyase)
MHSAIRIALVGDFNELQRAHQAIPRALSAATEGGVEPVWISTDSVARGDSLADFDGLWCVPGMPYRSADGAISAIRHARTSNMPFLGTSSGFQYALIEFARNVLGLTDADHQKSNPGAAMPLISPLGVGLAGVKARVRFTRGSHLHNAYRALESIEEYHCSFGLNGRYRRLIESGPMSVTAIDDQHEIRAVELDGHPFFVATLFQPEMRSLAEGSPVSPLVGAFMTACQRRHERLTKAAS